MRMHRLKLQFDAPEVERLFNESTAASRLQHFMASGWIALLVYNLFLLVDWHIAPDVFQLALALRLGVFTPLSVGVLLLGMRYRNWMLAHLPPRWIEYGIALTGLLAAMTMAAVLVFNPTIQQSNWLVYYHGGFVPVLIYGNVVQRLRFGVAVAFSASILLLELACLSLALDTVSAGLLITMPAFMFVMAGSTLITNYRLERDERERYLQLLRAQDLREQLHQTRQQLEASSLMDPLTGVANRRYFDDFLRTVWDARRGSGQAVALLLVDVDHFKAFNDHYGHPAGDECLRYVARALQDQVTGRDGLVARWGGEEFAVVLAGKDADQAMSVARHITQTIQGLGLRHERSGTAATVTVSVGVAIATPAADQALSGDLLARADAALYEAKRLGRNRVEISPAMQVLDTAH
ncbi:MAG TPA: GGDEF domain-containing protein [Aquabacterium sp.]|uniref:GGDEF domain-containing protein n=1 Tax=Aquabacterium sp. TaxID=1872578 RepID=UPI002E31B4F9|nr:GGDEF domain-containing protein [Aquabacterium sp.]HEX5373552.1 GGDEF domain-containing protein [Aquabacterium sp.]